MSFLTLLAAGFGFASGLTALALLGALARKLPFWVPGLVVLALAVLLAVSNTREHHAEYAKQFVLERFCFAMENALAIGVAVAGALGLAAGVRRRYRAHAPTRRSSAHGGGEARHVEI